jgi:hypothetical protein
MVITEEIKKRFQDCIGTTIIFCTSIEQAKILGKLYNGTAFQNLNILSKDIELRFNKNDWYSYQDGYNFTYFKSRNEWNWKTITFNQLMNGTNVYELW